jgi:tetratricopeptide (TPR) repeat protein
MRWLVLFTGMAFSLTALAGVEEDVTALQADWARIKYQRPAAEQEKAFAELTQTADAVRGKYAGRAEPQIWYGIIAASYAGARGGLGALGLAKDAKKALERALEIDPKALDGSAYTSLGSLYYQVPGWPIGFGNDEKARELLDKALALNPDGIDPNYFLGDFLYRKGDYAAARQALDKALKSPARPGRELADQGRRKEIESLLAAMR